MHGTPIQTSLTGGRVTLLHHSKRLRVTFLEEFHTGSYYNLHRAIIITHAGTIEVLHGSNQARRFNLNGFM